MKVKVRTLKNVEAEIDVFPEDTIRVVKAKVQEQLPSMDAERQTLIHAGRLLNNDCTIADYASLKENDKMVVMLTKTPASTNASSSTGVASTSSSPGEVASGSASATNANVPPTVEGAEQPGAAAPPTTTTTTSSTTTTTTTTTTSTTALDSSVATPALTTPMEYDSAASALLTGSQLEEMESNICAMGFERTQVLAAMRAAFNNPDRAVEYLMNGIPDGVRNSAVGGQAPAAATGEADRAPTGQPGDTILGMTSAATSLPAGVSGDLGAALSGVSGAVTAPSGTGHPLDTLRGHPMFDYFRTMVQANPTILPRMLDVIGQQNPQLLQVITENQEAFVDMLQEPVSMAETEAENPPGNVVSLGPAEVEAVQRLEGLGFSRQAVVEAYLACERNEEMAANYLFENDDWTASDEEGGER